jgi:hypothetical protein
MDTLSSQFAEAIGMVLVDAEVSPDIFSQHQIAFAPTIALFRHGKLRLRYFGEWTIGGLTEFCESVTDYDLVPLNDSFSVFEFQRRGPSNIVLSSPPFIAKADALLHKFGGVVQVAILENRQLKETLGMADAVFTRPGDFYTASLNDVDEDTLEALLQSKFQHIYTGDLFGVTPTADTIAALIDERDPLMVYDVVSRFTALRDVFAGNVSFQICDFFKCPNVVQQIKLIGFASPLYIHHAKQGGRFRLDPLQRMFATADEVVNWAKFQILGVSPPPEPHAVVIPRLMAHEFIQLVLDPKKEVVLFVAAPRMPLYEESAESVKKLMKVFEGTPEVRFYEFNPITEHVKGLEMPKSDKPQLSIWPASKEPNGSAFAAYLDVGVIFENLLKLFVTKFSEEKLAALSKRFQEVSQECEVP